MCTTADGHHIIEADDVSQFFEGLASLVEGKIVADEGYDPANDHPLPLPSHEQQIIAALYARVTNIEDG
ncbi:hypothetical protein HPY01_13855 [Lactobacillus rhamnosus]|nr:hypothetical protein [Lacticaseibacillus rhamnosus]